MRYIRLILVILLVMEVSSAYTANAYLNTPRIIRVGLIHAGHPKNLKLKSPNSIFEIIGLKQNQALFKGKADEIFIQAKKGREIAITVNGQNILASSSLTISATDIKNKTNNTITVTSDVTRTRTYRGSLEISSLNSQLYLVNIIDMEDYLKSVVPSEISVRAPQAAQEAQTIAARTYAVRNIHRHSKKDGYNLCDTVHCQAYFGITKEYNSATKAINSTIGKILIYNDSPANTVYHSNCGGYIISSQAAWGGKAVPYLIGHFDGIKGNKTFCEYGKEYQARNASLILPEKSTKLVIGRINDYSKKKLFKNFGHRVGMCQDGAIGMAAIGYSCNNILGFYYPRTTIATLKYAGNKPDSSKYSPTKITTLAKAKPGSSAYNLKAPIIPQELSSSQRIASASNKISMTNKEETFGETAKKNTKYSNKSNENNSVKVVLKEVSEVKPITTSLAIKKVFWRLLDVTTDISDSNTTKLVHKGSKIK